MLMEYGLLEDVGGGYDLDHWQSAGVAAGVGKETVLETEDCHLLPYILPICPTIFSIISRQVHESQIIQYHALKHHCITAIIHRYSPPMYINSRNRFRNLFSFPEVNLRANSTHDPTVKSCIPYGV